MDEQGIYLNLNKNGCDYNHRNRIFINPNESQRETSVSGILSHLGFDIPRDVVLHANRADIVSNTPNNAYMLASLGMNGKQIYQLCEELNSQGENLRDGKLSDEQLVKYGVKEQKDEIEKRMQQIIKLIRFEQIGKKIVAIYDGDDPMGAYFAYNNGAHICISVNEYANNDKNGVIFAVQSNPQKCDLPSEVVRWAINIKRKELLIGANPRDYGAKPGEGFKNIDDMLIKPTRIILGGNKRPDLFLVDRRLKSEKSFKNEIIEQLLNQIIKSEVREQGLDMVVGEDISSMISILDGLEKNENEVVVE